LQQQRDSGHVLRTRASEIKPRGVQNRKGCEKSKMKSLVKWKGYPETSNSWVDNKELIKL